MAKIINIAHYQWEKFRNSAQERLNNGECDESIRKYWEGADHLFNTEAFVNCISAADYRARVLKIGLPDNFDHESMKEHDDWQNGMAECDEDPKPNKTSSIKKRKKKQ
ncbi:MAG: hypothetical protein KGJ90_07135 [Patescibacteria group bacterium]|nr:hypothetical protein [Patescibacteria group bacterium]